MHFKPKDLTSSLHRPLPNANLQVPCPHQHHWPASSPAIAIVFQAIPREGGGAVVIRQPHIIVNILQIDCPV